LCKKYGIRRLLLDKIENHIHTTDELDITLEESELMFEGMSLLEACCVRFANLLETSEDTLSDIQGNENHVQNSKPTGFVVDQQSMAMSRKMVKEYSGPVQRDRQTQKWVVKGTKPEDKKQGFRFSGSSSRSQKSCDLVRRSQVDALLEDRGEADAVRDAEEEGLWDSDDESPQPESGPHDLPPHDPKNTGSQYFSGGKPPVPPTPFGVVKDSVKAGSFEWVEKSSFSSFRAMTIVGLACFSAYGLYAVTKNETLLRVLRRISNVMSPPGATLNLAASPALGLKQAFSLNPVVHFGKTNVGYVDTENTTQTMTNFVLQAPGTAVTALAFATACVGAASALAAGIWKGVTALTSGGIPEWPELRYLTFRHKMTVQPAADFDPTLWDMRADTHALMDLRHEMQPATVSHEWWIQIFGFKLLRGSRKFQTCSELLAQGAAERNMLTTLDSDTAKQRIEHTVSNIQTINEDRFDFLNSQMRSKAIFVLRKLHQSRRQEAQDFQCGPSFQ